MIDVNKKVHAGLLVQDALWLAREGCNPGPDRNDPSRWIRFSRQMDCAVMVAEGAIEELKQASVEAWTMGHHVRSKLECDRKDGLVGGK